MMMGTPMWNPFNMKQCGKKSVGNGVVVVARVKAERAYTQLLIPSRESVCVIAKLPEADTATRQRKV